MCHDMTYSKLSLQAEKVHSREKKHQNNKKYSIIQKPATESPVIIKYYVLRGIPRAILSLNWPGITTNAWVMRWGHRLQCHWATGIFQLHYHLTGPRWHTRFLLLVHGSHSVHMTVPGSWFYWFRHQNFLAAFGVVLTSNQGWQALSQNTLVLIPISESGGFFVFVF